MKKSVIIGFLLSSIFCLTQSQVAPLSFSKKIKKVVPYVGPPLAMASGLILLRNAYQQNLSFNKSSILPFLSLNVGLLLLGKHHLKSVQNVWKIITTNKQSKVFFGVVGLLCTLLPSTIFICASIDTSLDRIVHGTGCLSAPFIPSLACVDSFPNCPISPDYKLFLKNKTKEMRLRKNILLFIKGFKDDADSFMACLPTEIIREILTYCKNESSERIKGLKYSKNSGLIQDYIDFKKQKMCLGRHFINYFFPSNTAHQFIQDLGNLCEDFQKKLKVFPKESFKSIKGS